MRSQKESNKLVFKDIQDIALNTKYLLFYFPRGQDQIVVGVDKISMNVDTHVVSGYRSSVDGIGYDLVVMIPGSIEWNMIERESFDIISVEEYTKVTLEDQSFMIENHNKMAEIMKQAKPTVHDHSIEQHANLEHTSVNRGHGQGQYL